MKFLMVADLIHPHAGTGRNLEYIQRAVEGAGHDVVVFACNKGFLRNVWDVRRRLKGIDIVYVIDVSPLGYVVYIATLLTRIRYVIIAQAAYAVAPLYNWKRSLFTKIVYRSAGAIVSGSQYVADEIHKKLPEVMITIINPGIDVEKFSQSTSHRYVSDEAPYLLGVGAVKARKGYDVSIRAFALAKQKFPTLRYVIVGSQTNQPGFFKEMGALAQRLGVEKDVDFRTKVADPELQELYQGASLFILTSVNQGFHFEGFGMVFLEAAAYGVPSIGTLGNGIADAVLDGETGILVPQHDPGATAEAICRLLGDTSLTARMSARAREFVQEHDIRNLIQKYEKVNRSLVK